MLRKHNDKPIRGYSYRKSIKGAHIFEYKFKQSKDQTMFIREKIVSYYFLLLKGYIYWRVSGRHIFFQTLKINLHCVT